jgi:hypothetical protein
MNADLTFRDFQHGADRPYQGSEGVAGKPFFIAPSPPFQDFFATGGYILFYLLYTKVLHMIKKP